MTVNLDDVLSHERLPAAELDVFAPPRLLDEHADQLDQLPGRKLILARFLGGVEPEEVIFTSGTTESLNLVAYAWGDLNVHEGDEIVITEMEHHANLVPWQMLAAERGIELAYIPVTDEGRLDAAGFHALLERRTTPAMIVPTMESNGFFMGSPGCDWVKRLVTAEYLSNSVGRKG